MRELSRRYYPFLIAVAAAFLPLLFPKLTFLWVPGYLPVALLLGGYSPSIGLRVVSNLIGWPILLYSGAALWRWGRGGVTHPAHNAAKYLLAFWISLLIPWLLVAPLSLMAFDGGATRAAYAFVWTIWTYPITVAVAIALRRFSPGFTLLPVINFAGCGLAGFLPK